LFFTEFASFRTTYFVIHGGGKKSKKEPGIIKVFSEFFRQAAIPSKSLYKFSLPADLLISVSKTQAEQSAQQAKLFFAPHVDHLGEDFASYTTVTVSRCRVKRHCLYY
jgi:hypothetical protein